MNDTIKFLKTRSVKSPSRSNKYDAGIDFYVPEFTEQFKKDLLSKNPHIEYDADGDLILRGHQRILIPSGIHCQMADNGRALIAANKSGVATKTGIIFGAQVVDFEYQGEIHISLINTGEFKTVITPGMKIIQFLEMPVFNSEIYIDDQNKPESFYNNETTRGADGFGSTSHI
jgi:dUTPase